MYRLLQSIKLYHDGHKPLYQMSIIMLLWAIADGIVSFSLPIFMEEVFLDLSIVGLVFASSSVFGLISSLFSGSNQKGRTFKFYFSYSIILAVIVCLLTTKAQTAFLFLIIMALWGFYYDALNFSWIDFLGRFTRKWEHSQASGMGSMFYSLGYLLAPIIASYMILVGRVSMVTALFLFCLSALFFLFWFKDKKVETWKPKKISFTKEVKIWLQVAKKSVWIFTAFFVETSFFDGLIWSMGPILLVQNLKEQGAIIMACFTVPTVILEGYTGRLADKKGKKQLLTTGLLIAGLFLSLFPFSKNIYYLIFVSLASATGIAIFWPAAEGIVVDILKTSPKSQEEEIMGIRGVARNLGYVTGPIMAGFLGKNIGLPGTFCIFGCFLIVSAIMMKLLWRRPS